MRNLILPLAALALTGTALGQTNNLVFVTNNNIAGIVAPGAAGAIGQDLVVTNSRKVVEVDLDDDGDQDVLFVNHNQNNQGWLNTGGVFALDAIDASNGALYTNTAVMGAKGVAVGDPDGDGQDDVYIATGPAGGSQRRNLYFVNNSPGNDVVFVNGTGAAGFGAEVDHSYDAAFITSAVTGNLGMLVANRRIDALAGASGGNRHYTGNGAGVFTLAAAANGNFNATLDAEVRNSRALAVADFDGDGSQDVFVANAGNIGEANQVFRQNPATGLLTSDFVAQLNAAPGNSYAVAVGDPNNDGLPDLIIGNRASASSGEQNQFLFNTSVVGDIDFSDVGGTSFSLSTTTSYGVAFRDLDADGDLDIVVANNNENNEVYLNNQVENGVGLGASNGFFGQGAEAMFSQVTDGLIQNNGGQTRAIHVGEFGAYGPNPNHQGAEVVFANTLASGLNEFYRGMGKQFFDVGLGSTGGTTPVELAGDGFMAPGTGGGPGGMLRITDGEPNAISQLLLTTSVTNTPFNGGTIVADGGVVSGLFALNFAGNLDLAVADSDIPAALIGELVVVQVQTEDATLGAGQALSNGLTLVVQ